MKTAHVGPKNLLEHWNDSFPRSVLSQTKYCRTPENVFQGQTDVGSVSLCLWHLCLLSSGMAAAARWGKTKKEKCSEPASQRTEAIQSLYVFYQGLKDCTTRDTYTQCNIYQDEVVSAFPRLRKYLTRNTEMFKCVFIKSMVREFKGKVQTILNCSEAEPFILFRQ